VVDEYIPQPVRETDKPFMMSVEDVFSIKGRGRGDGAHDRGKVKTGQRRDRGLRTSDDVGGDRRGDVPQTLDDGQAGDNVGCCCAGSSGRTWSGGW